jgi:hypothetical protein
MAKPKMDELAQGETPLAHKIIIGECVIEWGRAESQLRALLTSLQGRALDLGANDYKRLSPDDAWKKIKRELILSGASDDVIEIIQKNREASRRFYSTRKHIIHSGLVGWWQKDPDYLAFAPFESDEIGKMVFVWLPIDEIVRSTQFAKATGQMANDIMRALGH